MASVLQILRDMATHSESFDYKVFKERLKKQMFSPSQSSMLQMRLDLLESFLDWQGVIAEPGFRAGELTIMDMSCPFVDANTACILFKMGLERYLNSSAAGKMVVLDEAHKVCTHIFSSNGRIIADLSRST
jgi:hypothetical protein